MDLLSNFAHNPLFAPVLAVALPELVLLGFLWWQAGSILSVIDRVWQKIIGKGDAYDPALRSFLHGVSDVERFRSITRARVETVADMQKLLAWMQARGVSIFGIRDARRWIDVSSPDIALSPPANFLFIRTTVIFALALPAIVVFFGLAWSPVAYLQMRTSGIWFATDATTVKVLHNGWLFNATSCASAKGAVQQMTGFDEKETIAICAALKKPQEVRAFVTQALAYQKSVGAAGISVAVVIVIANILAINSAQAALRLRRRLHLGTDGDH